MEYQSIEHQMRDKWEGLKNGCPGGEIQGLLKHRPAGYHHCRGAEDECHYKGCIVMYWFRHLMKPLFSKEELEEYKQYLEREKAYYSKKKPLNGRR